MRRILHFHSRNFLKKFEMAPFVFILISASQRSRIIISFFQRPSGHGLLSRFSASQRSRTGRTVILNVGGSIHQVHDGYTIGTPVFEQKGLGINGVTVGGCLILISAKDTLYESVITSKFLLKICKIIIYCLKI